MKFRRVLHAARNPANWQALARGIVPTFEHATALRKLAPHTVIDVGANKGQFSYFASRQWPEAAIHAFEPLPEPRTRLASLLGKRAVVHDCALGNAEATAELHVGSRADSSSLLPIGRKQSEIFSVSEVSTVSVPVKRLDQAVSDIEAPALLKIDVQGFEYEVLQGMGALRDVIRWIYVELSFVELYEGQRLFPEVDALLSGLGYGLASQHNVHCDEAGDYIQADALYVRQGEAR